MAQPLPQAQEAATPSPVKYEAWEDGERTRDIPIERVIGGPSFRSSHSDHLLQVADLIAHALLKQEEEAVAQGGAPGRRHGPSGPSTTPSTGERRGATARASSGDEGTGRLAHLTGSGVVTVDVRERYNDAQYRKSRELVVETLGTSQRQVAHLGSKRKGTCQRIGRVGSGSD